MLFHAKIHWAGLVAAACCCASLPALADNPIIQTNFTADPAPMVHGDTVYLYAGHDEDDAQDFKMRDWRLYSSKDMVNWTDHGTVASLSTFPWARQDNGAWAPQVVERNGKFYLYAPVTDKASNEFSIGVAVADSPLGPFKDALGRPLVSGAGFFDPTVLIDDDDQAYLYWGNPDLWYVKLNKDMVSYSGDVIKSARPEKYQEGPWAYKRNGHYYMAYASSCCSEGIGYAMSTTPTGPWQYQGQIMDPSSLSTGNHPGIIDFRGKSYVFGFNYRLNFAETPIHRERRSVTVAEIEFRADGTIPLLPFWNTTGVKQVRPLDPYGRVEAETIAWASRIARDRDRPFDWATGIKTDRDDKTGMYIYPAASASFVKVAGVDFGKRPPKSFKASVASAGTGGRIDVRSGSLDGPLIATIEVAQTGGEHVWKTQSVKASAITGQHDLYFVFNAGGNNVRFNVDYWSFEQ
jgi:arabinoxylan arabinofuranohydrolase